MRRAALGKRCVVVLAADGVEDHGPRARLERARGLGYEGGTGAGVDILRVHIPERGFERGLRIHEGISSHADLRACDALSLGDRAGSLSLFVEEASGG
jgi:hypothetical protein